jgi:hypothetical protein
MCTELAIVERMHLQLSVQIIERMHCHRVPRCKPKVNAAELCRAATHWFASACFRTSHARHGMNSINYGW